MNPADRHFQAAVAHYRRDENDLARDRLRAAIAADPDHGRAWELLGVLHRVEDEWEGVLAALETALVLVPLQPLAQCALADAYANTRRPSLALDGYRWLLSRENVAPLLLVQCGRGLSACGRVDLALQATRLAIRRDPDCSRAYFEAASYMARLDCPETRIEASLRRAWTLDPDVVEYRVGLAGFLHVKDRTGEAYAVVRSFTREDVAQVCCTCCLERLAELFHRANDLGRAHLCNERCRQLSGPGGAEDAPD